MINPTVIGLDEVRLLGGIKSKARAIVAATPSPSPPSLPAPTVVDLIIVSAPTTPYIVVFFLVVSKVSSWHC